MCKIIRKADIALFIALVLLGGALAVPALFFDAAGDTVRVTVSGKVFGTYPLGEDKKIEVRKNGNVNLVVIEDGCVKMESASCKNQICVHTGKIRKAGQSIVCLPNRVSVTIEGENNEEFDTISGK